MPLFVNPINNPLPLYHMTNRIANYPTPGPSEWRKMDWNGMLNFATHGNEQQKDSLVDFGYSGLPAWMFEELYFLAKGEEWKCDD